jgi:hypothetical protein
MQAQDTPDNSLFSFKIGEPPEEDDAQSTLLALSELLEDAKAKLQTMLILPNQNIEQLVQDAGPIRDLFLKIRGHLPKTAIEALIPAAYIESHQFEVLKAVGVLPPQPPSDTSEAVSL